jgi:peptide deformylase
MIYPIIAYGDPVLKKKAIPIPFDGSVDIKKLVDDMFETMYEAQGVGLAGPQIGLSQRIFVVDTTDMVEEGSSEQPRKQAFINAQVIEEMGDEGSFEEGCLSIPGIRGDVNRPNTIKLSYQDENGAQHEETFSGVLARVVQHEYDHIEGVLFTDLLSPLKKQLIRGKLSGIQKGKAKHSYRMKFYAGKK